MKIITGIMSCALATGLMTFASNNAQAAEGSSSGNIVIDNTLYSPLTVKLTVKYVDDNDKIKQASETSKDLLDDLGYDTSQVKLCLGVDGDVYVVNKKNGDATDVSNEELDNNMFVDTEEQLSTTKSSGSDDNKVTYQSEGQVEVEFEGDTSDFTVYGLYSATLSGDFNESKDTTKAKTSAKSMNLAGTADVEDLGENLPASGKSSGGGSGTLDGSLPL
jgi:hypothetical protein